MLKTSHRRLIGGVALAVGLVGLATPSAIAETDLGDLAVTPTTGPADSYITVDTPAACPAGATKFKVSLNGPGITSISDNNLNGVSLLASATPNPSGGVSVQAALTLKEIFQANGVVAPSGQYVVNFRCQSGDGGIVYGDFLATLNLVAGAAFDGTYTLVPPTPDGVATTTTLGAEPTGPLASGTSVNLTATVTPSNAVGAVQFKRGSTNISTPVAVSGGTASLNNQVLPAGTQSVTGVFVPTDANDFLTSTSAARSYVIAGPATVGITPSGTPRVGSTLSCNSTATTGATTTYNWFLGTKQTSTTTKTVKVPSTWKGLQAKCAVKTTKNSVTVTQTSALTAKIAAGLAPVATKKPYITGTLKVGYTLTCNKGTWTSSPTSYKYQWYRGTTALTGKVYSTYKTVSTDKGKYLKCRVTTVKSGYAAGVAYSAAKKIL